MKPKNQQKKLEQRIADWARMKQDNRHDNKVQLRIDNGGYHKPGSNRK